MLRARRNQRDLFDETPQMSELRPELHNTVAILLQALLTEAAGNGRPNRRITTAGRCTMIRITPDHLARSAFV